MENDGSNQETHPKHTPKQTSKKFPLTITLVAVFALALAAYLFKEKQAEIKHATALAAAAAKEQQDKTENTHFGLDYRNFEETVQSLKSGDVLGTILQKQGLTHDAIQKIVANSKGIFDIGTLRVGKDVRLLTDKNEGAPQYFIYEPSPYRYLTIQLQEPYEVKMTERPVEVIIAEASGILESSFWQAMTDNGLSYEVADAMISVLESSVDFYHQQVGDRFKVVYEQHLIDGEPVGMGSIHAALYERGEDKSYVFAYTNEEGKTEYFDDEGRSARKAFLRAPVKFSRISSRFSRSRFHPVLRYRRPHLGTDYAAAHGTPIMAVAAGTVTEATRRGGNGKYVRIRHDKTYETQYLHMSNFAKGIRPGKFVDKGEIIGYVGSTGLATGPHVCFRFWKNGKQVDFLSQKLPAPEPMNAEQLELFKVVRDSLMQKLEAVPYRTQAEIYEDEEPVSAEEEVNP